MKAIRFLAAIVPLAAAALAGCTHETPQLSMNPGYRLGYDDKGASVALVYGLPNSDDLALMLECPKGSGRVELTDAVRDKQAKTVTLTADGRGTTVPVKIETGVDDYVVTGRLGLSAPALQGFRRSGVMQVANGRARYVIKVDAKGRAGVERFFEVCG